MISTARRSSSGRVGFAVRGGGPEQAMTPKASALANHPRGLHRGCRQPRLDRVTSLIGGKR
jgi:hypothetical protein